MKLGSIPPANFVAQAAAAAAVPGVGARLVGVQGGAVVSFAVPAAPGIVYLQTADIIGTAITTEQILNSISIPAATLSKVGDALRLSYSWVKTGQGAALFQRIRMGASGTSADTQLFASNNTGKSIASSFTLRRVSSTTVQMLGNNNANGSFTGNTNDTPQPPFTVGSLDSVIKVSFSCQMDSTAETPTFQSLLVEVLKA